MAVFNEMLDDWIYDSSRNQYINRWDSSIVIDNVEVRIQGIEPTNAAEQNRWLNSLAAHMKSKPGSGHGY